MIAANYAANFYCDGEICTEIKWDSPDVGEYVGEPWTECATAAGKDGWRISKNRPCCYAPGHKVSRGANQ